MADTATCPQHASVEHKLDQIMECLCGDPSNPDDNGIKGELLVTRQSAQKAADAVGEVVKTLEHIRPKVDMHDKVIIWAGRIMASGLAFIGTIATGLAINALTCNTINAEKPAQHDSDLAADTTTARNGQ